MSIGLKDALGDKYAKMVVKEVSYEATDPTIDTQVIALARLRRRHADHRGDSEIRRAGDPQGRRDRLEAAALHDQRLDLGRAR